MTTTKPTSNTNDELQPLLLRVDEAAQLLNLGRSTLYEMIYKGDIASVKYGSARRIPLAEIHRWIAAHTVRGA